MQRTIGLIHYFAENINLFKGLIAREIPCADTINFLDEGLVKDLIANGGKLTDGMAKRIGLLASFAEESGAEVILVTGSSFGPLIKTAQKTVRVPIVRVDEPMMDRAIETGNRIGVLVTADITIKPTTELLLERAAAKEKKVEVMLVKCEGAFAAFRRGDIATHDRIVRENLLKLMNSVDAVILAQATMAHVADQLTPEERNVPILTSARLAVLRVKELLEKVC
jgi:Asp/Glu/hydantoin racemase